MAKVILKTVQILVMLSLVFASGCKKDKETFNQLPTCKIVNPSEGEQFNFDENVLVNIVAEDRDGRIEKVQLYVDDVGYSEKNSFPYNFTINARELVVGKHTLKVVVKDDKGKNAEDTVCIIIKQGGNGTNQPPICNITNPQNNEQFSVDKNITVTVVAEDSDGDITRVQLYVDNVAHSLKTEFPYNFIIGAGELLIGTHTLKAVAIDNQGAEAESTVSIIIGQGGTASAPVITMPSTIVFDVQNPYDFGFDVAVNSADEDLTSIKVYIQYNEYDYPILSVTDFGTTPKEWNKSFTLANFPMITEVGTILWIEAKTATTESSNNASIEIINIPPEDTPLSEAVPFYLGHHNSGYPESNMGITWTVNIDVNTAKFTTVSYSNDFVMLPNEVEYNNITTVEDLTEAFDAGSKTNSFTAKSDAYFQPLYLIVRDGEIFRLIKMTALTFMPEANKASFMEKH